MGIVRVSQHSMLSDTELDEFSQVRFVTFDNNAMVAEKHHILTYQQQKYLKFWHNHGPIAGRGHFKVLVAGIYDPLLLHTRVS